MGKEQEQVSMGMEVTMLLKKILRNKRDEGYIDVCVLVLCAMLVSGSI